jgi:ligand-binding sensor domain-containing protein
MQSVTRLLLFFTMVSVLVACSASDEQGWTSYTCATDTHDMVFDQDGYLWAVGSKGVRRIKPTTGTCSKYTTRDGLANDRVRAVAVSPDGTLWFGTSDGVSSFDGKKWTTYQEGYVVPAVATALDGSLWIGARLELEGCHKCGWAARFDGTDWTSHRVLNGCGPVSIAQAPAGDLWFGTSCGIASFDGKTWLTYTIPGPSISSAVVDMVVTDDGDLWVGSIAGLARFDGEIWETYGPGNGLPSNRIMSIAEAPDGALWVGTSGGLSKYDGRTWTTFTAANGLIDDQVHVITVGPDNTLWFGTSKGVSRYAPPE